MNNATQRKSRTKPIASDTGEHNEERAHEARLAADFTRLLQQYRRAGYECFQRTQQSDDNIAT